MITSYYDLMGDKPSRHERLEYASWEALARIIPGYGRPPKPVPVPGGGI